jgi:oligopeptide transport system ATP-binding protein
VSALLEVHDLSVGFDVRHGGRSRRLQALHEVSLRLSHAETLGIVGESGSGKSTLARTLLRLTRAESGSVHFGGVDLLALRGRDLQQARSRLQMIFQDGIAALDPRQRIAAVLEEPLQALRPEWPASTRRERALSMLARVGLEPQHLLRYPHELSGGQAQRIGIARALIVQPELVVCDEPLASLDVSVKAQITALLLDLRRQLQLSMIFIAHDLPAVQLLSDRVLVLYLGRVMEIAPRDALFGRARHPYTRALLQSVPVPDPRVARARAVAPLSGEPPSPLSPPSGCVFRTRCPLAIGRCAQELPQLRRVGDSEVACHLAEEIQPPAAATRTP